MEERPEGAGAGAGSSNIWPSDEEVAVATSAG